MSEQYIDVGFKFLNEKSLKTLKDFGYSRIGHLRALDLSADLQSPLFDESKFNVIVDSGFMIVSNKKSISNQEKFIRKMKKYSDFILLQANNNELSKDLIRKELIDGLYLSFKERRSLISEGVVSLLSQNNIPVLIPFEPLLEQVGYVRSHIIRRMKNEVKLFKDKNVPIVITSGASSYWDLRAPRELMSFGKVLGLSLMDAKSSLTFKPLSILE